ncbi:uncharacterized protein LACBIDRAFT_332313 [Laccaria bicolor S238N-H82]|uniref:Predicted protein n=1 Tax=Laccaria bicolor (strain S238N-H82 / ATCC MYA-4686) TaxID=486041 RepID=B0DSA9_LACBS|nr:uncharacterized protein LACBIDRAFT_332313 [Laccaria bicolor S238N-H82]EDR02442.1 predicted protein [Laccaria bicolor S238N-H82]|eukprot:XP_001886805.1 predicted protein [Laccaria bicolor S238N-H82]
MRWSVFLPSLDHYVPATANLPATYRKLCSVLSWVYSIAITVSGVFITWNGISLERGNATWTLCLRSTILLVSPFFMRMFLRLDFTQSITSLMSTSQICASRRSDSLVMPIPKLTSLAHLSYPYASLPVVDEETHILSFGSEFPAVPRPPMHPVAPLHVTEFPVILHLRLHSNPLFVWGILPNSCYRGILVVLLRSSLVVFSFGELRSYPRIGLATPVSTQYISSEPMTSCVIQDLDVSTEKMQRLTNTGLGLGAAICIGINIFSRERVHDLPPSSWLALNAQK